MVVGISFSNAGVGGSVPTVSDSKGNCSGAWSSAVSREGAASNVTVIYYCVPTTVGTGHTVTISVGSGYIHQISAFFAAYSGVAATSPLDQFTSGSTTITPTQNGELILTVDGGDYYGSSASIDSGFGILGSSSCPGSCSTSYFGTMAYLVQSTAALIAPTWTQLYIDSVVIASFKAAAPSATSYTFTGPSPASGGVGVASGNFTVTPNGTYTGTITPSSGAGGGTFSPASLTFSGTSAAQTFTYTPASSGSKTISVSASPALGTDPSSITYTASSPAFTYLRTVCAEGTNPNITIDSTGADLLVAVVSSGNVAPVVTADSKNTYTNWVSIGTQSNSRMLYYPHPPVVGTGHWIETNGSNGTLCVSAFSGLATSAPYLDQFASAAGTQPGSITPTVSNELVVGGYALPPGWNVALTVDGTMTLGGQIPWHDGAGAAIAYKAQTTAAAINPTWNMSGQALIASFKSNAVASATSYTFTAPSPASGNVGAASGNFTVTPNGTYTGTITPSSGAGGGTFSPTSLTFSGTSAAQTFTYTPASSGSKTISVSASPALGTDPSSVTYTALSTDSSLSNLTISQGTLSPTFTSGTISYTDSVANGVSSLTVTPTVNQGNATVTVGGTPVTSGSPSGSISLSVGSNSIPVVVTAQSGGTTTYTITVTRADVSGTTYTISITSSNGSVSKSPDQLSYDSGASVTLTATADSNYTFSSWSGDISSSVNPITITMDVNKNITANFTANALPGGGGGGGGGGNYYSPTPTLTVILGCGNKTTGFSTVSGQSCANNLVTTSNTIPTIISGCDNRTTGFSTVSGQSCVNNIGNGTTTNTSVSSGLLAYNFGFTTLRLGSQGAAVKELQRYLNDKLHLGLVLDGKLGPKTILVIKQWQKNHNLVPDGLVGPRTKAMMILEQ